MEEQNQSNQAPVSNSSSKKTLYIVIGVVVLLLIIGGFVMKGRQNIVPGTNVQNNLNGETTYSNDEGTVTVGGNSYPANWPTDVPKYNSGSIQYSGTSNPQTGAAGAAVVFTTNDSAQTILDFYKSQLVSQGWKVEQTAVMGAATVLAASKDSRSFGIYITDSGTSRSVTIGIELSAGQ